jgi:hypothetical protein
MAVLSANARLLVAPKGEFDRGHIVLIDPTGSGLKLGDFARILVNTDNIMAKV